LALQSLKARFFSLGGRSAATHRIDHVATPARLFKIESGDGLIHPFLQDLDRDCHLH